MLSAGADFSLFVIPLFVLQVVTSFIEDKNEEASGQDCAAYTNLLGTLTPQPCNSKHEWICKVPQGSSLCTHKHKDTVNISCKTFPVSRDKRDPQIKTETSFGLIINRK